MRALLALAMVPLAACSTLLGIQEPSTGDGGDGSGTDSGIDAPITDHLTFSVGDFSVAQLQVAKFHVLHIHRDGVPPPDDVTATATYVSDNDQVVTVVAGKITSSGAQSGFSTITASLGGMSATVKVTVKTTLCHPVINEVVTGSNVPTTGPADEYVEIYNPCMQPMSVVGWTLNYRGANSNGPTDSTPMVTLAGSMVPDEVRLYAGAGYTGTTPAPVDTWPGTSGVMGINNGAVGLRSGPKDTGPLVDSIAYGTVIAGHPFIEGHATSALGVGLSASRLPFDGKDEGDAAVDFVVGSKMTPGALNAP